MDPLIPDTPQNQESRTKRSAPFGFIGTIESALYGLADESFIKTVTSDFSEVKNYVKALKERIDVNHRNIIVEAKEISNFEHQVKTALERMGKQMEIALDSPLWENTQGRDIVLLLLVEM